MPGLDRPNAPRRLPSGAFVGPQFRKGLTDTSSQSPHSTPSSPSQISPKTVILNRRTFSGSSPSHLRQSSRSVESGTPDFYGGGSPSNETRKSRISSVPSHLRQRSDSFGHDAAALPFSEGATGFSFLNMIAPGLRRESRRPIPPNSNSPSPAASSSANSARSSISTKARRLLSIPPLRIADNATKDGGPPRDPKRGFHWQREISGHWLEIRIGKRQSPNSRGSPAVSTKPSSSSRHSTSTLPSTPAPTKASTKAGALTGSVDAPESTSRWLARHAKASTSGPRAPESMKDKALRHLGLKRGVGDHYSGVQNLRTNTGERLERTTSLLNVVASKQSQEMSNKSTSTLSSSRKSHHSAASSVTRWQRILTDRMKSDDSVSNESSASTGATCPQLKPPQTTPNPQEMYTASDHKQYFRIEMTDADGPNYLPSEARRVNTPPVSRSSRNRAFFFDHKLPDIIDKQQQAFRSRPSWRRVSSSEETEMGFGNTPGRKTRRVSMTEWYNVQLEAIEQDYERTKFVHEVPDHLSNSPLCPLHPKNKSGGYGVCPLHGERQREEVQGKKSEGLRGSEVHSIEY